MDMAQKQQFTDRISRISSGGPNTFGTVYCGVQDVDTPKGKKVNGVTQISRETPDRPGFRTLMKAGFVSGIMQCASLGGCAYLYMTYVGV